MPDSRRSFLKSSMLLSSAAAVSLLTKRHAITGLDQFTCVQHRGFTPPTHSVIPVVGDGKWIWNEPPSDGQTGYLDPRDYDVSVSITLRGKGNASEIFATTVAPSECPEQKILKSEIQPVNCQAQIVELSKTASQLAMYVPRLASNQAASVTARFRVKLFRDYRGFTRDQFPADQSQFSSPTNTKQSGSSDTSSSSFAKQYLSSSPGIKINSSALKRIVKSLQSDTAHPWDRAKSYYQWVWKNIKGIPGTYTSVEAAIKNRKGDCEERAAVFVALCRAAGIPARLVWIPGHNWAEIGLYDQDGQPHWIPIHTAAYSWFGWTGTHELIFQKGDNFRPARRKKSLRLIDDWYQCRGRTPQIEYRSTIEPVADKLDPGPGAREKQLDGRWRLVGKHPAQKFLRSG